MYRKAIKFHFLSNSKRRRKYAKKDKGKTSILPTIEMEEKNNLSASIVWQTVSFSNITKPMPTKGFFRPSLLAEIKLDELPMECFKKLNIVKCKNIICHLN